jgi:diaminohydroxyphosphoribosylaminopyrimidine deaminase/5-amino-6-(5-phosphoribosylamino)uracil reductase
VTPDEKYMQVALRLARRGIGSVEPNPVVGCIIVKGGQIIGRGWHRKFGGPHAEVNALENCQKNGISPRNAAMYVTLEPCCHHGKTSPCTDAIVEADLAKVVVATLDPSEHAGGKGIKQLRNAGIEVQTGLCEEQAKLLNAPFIKFAATGRCWVILKWAQSIDGMLAWANKGGNHRWISGEKSRKDVHKLRRRAQATLVGVRTVLADDPLLTARPSKGKKPLRVVLDSNLRTPVDCKLLATAKKSPVLIVTSQEAISANPSLAKKITEKGAELLAAPTAQGRCDLNFLTDELSRQGIAQLLVEGGPTAITSFLKQGLADEICVYIAPKILGPQGSVNITEPMAKLSEAVGLHYVDIKRFGDDVCLTGLSKKTLDEISVVEG